VASERETALLRQILDRPEDLAARAVYADALQARGDPRGEMIALELAGAYPQAAELRRAHSETWWPELAGLAFATRAGFVYRIRTTADRLAALQPLFAREPVRELELDAGAIIDPLPATVTRLSLASNIGVLASIDLARIERLELVTTFEDLQALVARDWPAVRVLRLLGEGLPVTWRAALREVAPRMPRLERIELYRIALDAEALAKVSALVPGVEVEAARGAGPFTLDLPTCTIELANAAPETWSVTVDGAPARVRWTRKLQRTGHVVEPWQIADVAPLEQVVNAIARNARRTLRGDELELWLPTIQQRLNTLGVMTFQAYDTLWELVETARISYDPAARELSVTFLERHVRPDVDDAEELFD
jgi:uncharacterized protein (TIGR02996 family)